MVGNFKKQEEFHGRISFGDETDCKAVPWNLALDHVDFTLEQGEVMALIGENGAGKSTLMNVLMGMLQPDSGEMVLRGQTITNRSPYEALQKGIGMVPQELNLVSDLSIAENIFLGLHQKKGIG